MAARYTLKPLDDALGAEITDLDLRQPLDNALVAELRDALQQHHVLCFRRQELTEEQQVEMSTRFGPLEAFPEADKTKKAPTIYNVANVTATGESLPETDHRVVFQKVNARWHTDSSYRYIPSYASLLYGIEVLPDEAEGGRTGFANMLAAYDALPEETKELIEPLHMVHYYEFGRRLFPSLPPITQHEKEQIPPVSHPLVRVHPDRGNRRSLFMTANSGNEISGMTLEEGQALHRQLVEHLSQPQFCYFHKWQQGDLVMWDNRVTLHRAEAYDMGRYRRVFRRTTLAGDGPILGPFSNAVRKKLRSAA
ncbi:TauD/TfdA dioxygenase family protein [Aquibaculum sediminis]|uniref:TauD/TfdA dioxygenase family protein n=1 Tax=Aquibaculum sediminis TaxID=3231907 RepID=UPI00345605FC